MPVESRRNLRTGGFSREFARPLDIQLQNGRTTFIVASMTLRETPHASGPYLQRLSCVLRSRHLRWQPAHAVLSSSEMSIILS